MRYKDQEIDISKTNYSEGVAILSLSDGSIVCIPDDGATVEELKIIQQVREDVSSRTIPEPVIAIEPIEPTVEEYLVDLDLRLSMIELRL